MDANISLAVILVDIKLLTNERLYDQLTDLVAGVEAVLRVQGGPAVRGQEVDVEAGRGAGDSSRLLGCSLPHQAHRDPTVEGAVRAAEVTDHDGLEQHLAGHNITSPTETLVAGRTVRVNTAA